MKNITKRILIFVLFFSFLTGIVCDINIHIIPHTHLDPGWLHTPNEYYLKERIDKIFVTVLEELSNSNDKTFVINEIYYFKIWYSKLYESDKNKFKKLLEDKRIEFVLGGYVVNDEATPLYYNIIDQIRVGEQFLHEEFGITPKTAWYIDSFGHSAGNAHVLAQLNYDNLVIGRMHVGFKELMRKNKNVEFFWEPFGSKNSNKKILTHSLPIHYGFALFLEELGLNNDKFKRSFDHIVTSLLDFMKTILDGVKHNNIIFLYGDDFQFKDNNLFSNINYLVSVFANKEDSHLKNLIKIHLNTEQNVNLFYSTPEKYFNMVKQELSEKKITLDTYSNKDFFPLKSDCYWTGFFTSRPFLKGAIRKGSNIFYSYEKYHSFNKFLGDSIPEDVTNNLNQFREAVGLVQHHDAITGTCAKSVAKEYIERIRKSIFESEQQFSKSISKKLNIEIGKICYNNYFVDENDCSNEFTIEDQNEKEIVIGLYNPTFSSNVNTKILITIEIKNSNYIYEIDGIKSDFFCINDQSINNGGIFYYKNKCFLYFFYDFTPEEEITYVTLIKTEKVISSDKYIKIKQTDESTIKLIENGENIQSLTFIPKNFEFNLEYYNEVQKINTIKFTYYDGMYYSNEGCTDGAYIFSPYNKYPDKIKIDYDNSFYIKGELGIILVTRNAYSSFTIFTLFYNPLFAKVEHIFDSYRRSYFLNRFTSSYAFTFKTDINNLSPEQKPIFYTDANGLEGIRRIIDTFEYKDNDADNVGGNFYPVSSFISIKDENNKENSNNKIAVFCDRPQGGTGYVPGSVTLILQRMSYDADHRGLTENMYENESMNSDNFKTTHFITFGLSINKDKKDESPDFKFTLQKTDLLNFVFNNLNTAVSMFKIIKVESTAFSENNKLIGEINKQLTISPDIRANYEIINNNLIIGEFFRYNNYFFDADENTELKNNTFGSVFLNFEKNTNFKIYVDKTGINYNIMKEKGQIFSDEIKSKFVEPKNQLFSSSLLGVNEFLYIYFYFE